MLDKHWWVLMRNKARARDNLAPYSPRTPPTSVSLNRRCRHRCCPFHLKWLADVCTHTSAHTHTYVGNAGPSSRVGGESVHRRHRRFALQQSRRRRRWEKRRHEGGGDCTTLGGPSSVLRWFFRRAKGSGAQRQTLWGLLSDGPFGG